MHVMILNVMHQILGRIDISYVLCTKIRVVVCHSISRIFIIVLCGVLLCTFHMSNVSFAYCPLII